MIVAEHTPPHPPDWSINYIDGLAQDCSNSIANALELLYSCAKPLICSVDCVGSMLVEHYLIDLYSNDIQYWRIR